MRKTKASHSSKVPSCQPSVEDIIDEDFLMHRNAGKPMNPDAILEAVDGSDDGVLPKRLLKKKIRRWFLVKVRVRLRSLKNLKRNSASLKLLAYCDVLIVFPSSAPSERLEVSYLCVLQC
jgi:hypothetical protein